MIFIYEMELWDFDLTIVCQKHTNFYHEESGNKTQVGMSS